MAEKVASIVVTLSGGERRNVFAADDMWLTDAEREAVEFFGKMEWPTQSQQIKARAATLRGLLERLGATND